MKNTLRFTVVTPNYNMAAYLTQTIESVLACLGPDDEYFVIDGGSTDGSVEILRRYADRLTGWVSEPDQGYADAIHKGFSRASGRYLCWINSSDFLLPGALNLAAQHIDKLGCDMIFGDDLCVGDDNRIIEYSRGDCGNLAGMMLFGEWTPLQDACFWRSDLYRKVGGLDVSMRNAADFDLFARFAVTGDVRYVPEVFSAFRRHNGQKSLANSQAYRDERTQSRQVLIAQSGYGVLRRLWLRAIYFVAVRWRAHVMHRHVWRVSGLAGQNALEVAAGTPIGRMA